MHTLTQGGDVGRNRIHHNSVHSRVHHNGRERLICTGAHQQGVAPVIAFGCQIVLNDFGSSALRQLCWFC